MQVWFITGASRGFGLEIARKALENGNAVVATARDPQAVHKALPDAGSRLLAVGLDVTDESQVQEAATAAVERFARIDVLVNNAGRGLVGAVEEASAEEIRAVFDTNVFGVLSVNRAVLPVLRRQRSGHVINISSVGGFTAGVGWGIYAGTKFAVEGISEAMRTELLPLGIFTTVVEPGVFRTDFLDGSSLHHTRQTIQDYSGSAGQIRDWVQQTNHVQPGDPVKAAAAIVELAQADEPPLRLQLGADCVARVEAKLAYVADELTKWRRTALATGATVPTPDSQASSHSRTRPSQLRVASSEGPDKQAKPFTVPLSHPAPRSARAQKETMCPSSTAPYRKPTARSSQKPFKALW